MKKAIIIVGILICIVIIIMIIIGHNVPIKRIVVGFDHHEGGSYTFYDFKRNYIKETISDSGEVFNYEVNYYNYTDTMLELLNELEVKLENNDMDEKVISDTNIISFNEECEVTLKNGEIKDTNPDDKTIVKIFKEITNCNKIIGFKKH